MGYMKHQVLDTSDGIDNSSREPTLLQLVNKYEM